MDCLYILPILLLGLAESTNLSAPLPPVICSTSAASWLILIEGQKGEPILKSHGSAYSCCSNNVQNAQNGSHLALTNRKSESNEGEMIILPTFIHIFHVFPITVYSFYLFPMKNWGFSCPKHRQLMSEPEFEPRDQALHLGPSPGLTWVFHHLWSKPIMMADTTYRYHFLQRSNGFKDAVIIG